MHPLHRTVDFSGARRVFVFGDIHGRLDTLRDAMAANDFDADAGDRMVGLGDWLDRGPDTHAIADFIEEMGEALVFVRGNHEMLLWNAGVDDGLTNAVDLWRNGGQWSMDEISGEHDRHVDFNERTEALRQIVNAAPVALTVRTPGGAIVGMVHANLDGTDWINYAERLDKHHAPFPERQRDIIWQTLWSRTVFNNQRAAVEEGREAEFDCYVSRIDHVFQGHSPANEPITHNNRSWIDTGACFRGGKLTFINVDTWLARGFT